MARSAGSSIYDKDNEKPSTKPDLGKGKKVSSIPAEQLERIPTADDRDASGEDHEKRALDALNTGKEPSASDASGDGSGGQGKSLYKPKSKAGGFAGRLNSSRSLKRYIVLGGFGAALIAAIIALVSFLGVFKLDGLMSSIESKAFLRNNAVLDTRSSKLMSAYVEARMMDMGDNPDFSNPDFKKDDNLLFRADRVDTNNPFFDWYRTMRASKFEQQLLDNEGIKFRSMVNAKGQLRPGFIDVNGTKSEISFPRDPTGEEFDLLQKGDIPTLQKFGAYVQSQEFSSNKEARAAIKDAVERNTSSKNVFKRRALRHAIQNMTGVKSWRFFETTRDKAAQTRIDIRNKIIKAMVPDTNMLGKVTRCLFGVDKCSANRDVAAESNHADSTTEIGTKDPNPPDDAKTAANLGDQAWDPGKISDFLTGILEKAGLINTITSLPSTLDMLSSVNKNISHIVKLVVVARGAQAAGLFQVFETSRDQIKTGQVTSGEVNQFMESIDTAGNSDGESKVIEGKGDPGTAYSQGACSQDAQARYAKDPVAYLKKYSNYGYLCANQRIGSAANAQEIQSDYDNTLGQVIGPIASAWDGANSTPVVGQFISVLRWVGSQISGLQNKVVNAVLSALGLKDNVNDLISYLFGKVTAFLGVAIINGNETAGTLFNWLVQGASYTAESATRQEGGALTTPASKAATQGVVGLYVNDQKSAPIFDRVASLSNPNSLAFRGAMALENVKSDPSAALMSGIHGMFGDLGNNIAMIFGRSATAATPDGYSASKFADIETYDYPAKCYNMDPITSTPIDGTNALDVFADPGAYGVSHAPINVNDTQLAALNSWDTEESSSKFFSTIYDVLSSNGIKDNADDIAVQIYNCNLLDATVRDSLGYTNGYSAGPDFDVNSVPDPDATGSTTTTTTTTTGDNTTTTSTAGATIDMAHLYDTSVAVACAPGTRDIGPQDGYTNGNLVKIELCAIPNLPSTGEESSGGFGVTGGNGDAVVNSRVSGAVLAMAKAALADGLQLKAGSSFRTMTHQQQICAGNSGCANGDYTDVAKPGTSNHQMGLAIDFAGGLTSDPGPVPGNAFWDWLSQNASLFGYKNYPAEAWHWSPTGN